jgi:hypothetical protein
MTDRAACRRRIAIGKLTSRLKTLEKLAAVTSAGA